MDVRAWRRLEVWVGNVVHGQQDRSGLMYMRNRYYDPATGRFTQQDPIGLAGGLNLYGFANGDPVNFSDPFGLCPGCILAVKEIATDYAIAKATAEDYGIGDALVSGVLGATGAGLVAKAFKGLRGFLKGRSAARGAARATSLPTRRVGHANKVLDAQHGWSDMIDNYADDAAVFRIPTRSPGGQVVRHSELRQIEGSLEGQEGVFEWIVDQGEVSHRRFIPGGRVTGLPNQSPDP